ncbi:hypothetical protein DFH09DRAFT_1270657 [Mycena vulgaris]|nr:hypothetical protein DFH09DRAFT_1270657 [Mycena vulgaris]
MYSATAEGVVDESFPIGMALRVPPPDKARVIATPIAGPYSHHCDYDETSSRIMLAELLPSCRERATGAQPVANRHSGGWILTVMEIARSVTTIIKIAKSSIHAVSREKAPATSL